MAGDKSGRYIVKPKRERDVPHLKRIVPVNDHSAAAVNDQNYRLLKNSSRYDKSVTKDLLKMTKKIAIQMKVAISSGKDRLS